MRHLVILITICTVMVMGIVSHAQDPTEEAKEAFGRGKVFFNEGKYVEASEAFKEAYRLRPKWTILYNIGQCEVAAKRYGLALEAFEEYLAKGGDDIEADRNAEVLGEVTRIRKMIGLLEIEAPAGAKVEVDEVDRGEAPLPGLVPVVAGVMHEVRVSMDDKEIGSRTVKLIGGQTVKLEFEQTVEDEGALTEPVEEEPVGETGSEDSKSKKPLGWTFVGVGGALVIGGVVTGAAALSKANDLETACEDGGCTEEQWDENDLMNTLGVVTDVLIGVGAAAVLTGVVVLIVSAKKERKANVAFEPLVSPGFAGVAVGGRF